MAASNDRASPSSCPATTRKPPSARPCAISAPRCRRRKIYVYDNNSKDRTADVAREAGAIVRSEMRQGKGNVMRRMFADVEADIYVLVDGDDTYDASAAPALISKLVEEGLDIVTGRRVHTEAGAYRAGHVLGQPDADRPDGDDVQRQARRHAERLPHHVAALREVVSRSPPKASASRPS